MKISFKNTSHITILLLGILLTSFIILFVFRKDLNNNKFESRQAFENAAEIVKQKKPTPTQAAYFYAKVSEIYYDKYYGNENEKNEYVNFVFSTSTLVNLLNKTVEEEDFYNKKMKIKNGIENWVGENPFSPGSGQNKRFFLDENFTYKVPPPPVFNGPEFKLALEEVTNAAKFRTVEQGAIINYWGGVPGTETPSGLWQNHFYKIISKDKNIMQNLNDEKFAYIQMILAQSLADSFMETWKVKYMYQTKRPNMINKDILLAMPNPPFPSYVSGHSTISFTAATILSHFFPDQKEIWFTDAKKAKNSRLHAGIHFPYDNDEGEKLGNAVGEYILKSI